MCGIVGILDTASRPIDATLLRAMNDSLRHRGPDDAGTYLNGHVGLAMRRLAIIDLVSGCQPVHNEDKSVWVVFNGEIYNYPELRAQLEQAGHTFYTQTDTETLVHLYEEFGDAAVNRLRGMFAYALWDEKRRRLVIARDRLGIKPLYYTLTAGRLLFASELKAILCAPWITPELDPRALQRFLAYLYVPGPDTIFRHIRELPPAHYLTYDANGLKIHQYWHLTYAGDRALSAAEWQEEFLAQFRESIRRHLMSDVPLGAFLSGGIDSSAVVAMMAQELNRPVETFSVGYEGRGAFQDERKYARLVARRFGTHHHEFVVSPNIRDLLPKLVSCFDQPFADSSAIPNFYISQMTRRHVTVALSGLGGDELAGGYERYLGMLWAETFRRLPSPAAKRLLKLILARMNDSVSGRPWVNRLKRFANAADLAPDARYAAFLSTFSAEERARLLTQDFRTSIPDRAEDLVTDIFASSDADSLVHYLMLTDLKLYLPGDLLTLTDRVSMFHSLEVRVPFLDHPLVELMARVPAELKVSGWTKKILLKKAFAGLLPRQVLYRRKLGFSIPLGVWLRTDLLGLMRDVLSYDEITRLGYLNYAEVQRIMDEHLSGRANCENKLWALMNLVLWHRLIRDGHPQASPADSSSCVTCQRC